MAITKWEIDYKKYLDAGGSELNDEDLRMTLLQLLPQQLREGLIWRATESRTYADFREHVRIKSEQILMLRSKLPVYSAATPTAEQSELGRLLAEEFPDKNEEILAPRTVGEHILRKSARRRGSKIRNCECASFVANLVVAQTGAHRRRSRAHGQERDRRPAVRNHWERSTLRLSAWKLSACTMGLHP